MNQLELFDMPHSRKRDHVTNMVNRCMRVQKEVLKMLASIKRISWTLEPIEIRIMPGRKSGFYMGQNNIPYIGIESYLAETSSIANDSEILQEIVAAHEATHYFHYAACPNDYNESAYRPSPNKYRELVAVAGSFIYALLIDKKGEFEHAVISNFGSKEEKAFVRLLREKGKEMVSTVLRFDRYASSEILERFKEIVGE